jgi:hypothetical protein
MRKVQVGAFMQSAQNTSTVDCHDVEIQFESDVILTAIQPLLAIQRQAYCCGIYRLNR